MPGDNKTKQSSVAAGKEGSKGHCKQKREPHSEIRRETMKATSKRKDWGKTLHHCKYVSCYWKHSAEQWNRVQSVLSYWGGHSPPPAWILGWSHYNPILSSSMTKRPSKRPWRHPRSGWSRLWATWLRCSCWLQGGWVRCLLCYTSGSAAQPNWWLCFGAVCHKVQLSEPNIALLQVLHTLEGFYLPLPMPKGAPGTVTLASISLHVSLQHRAGSIHPQDTCLDRRKGHKCTALSCSNFSWRSWNGTKSFSRKFVLANRDVNKPCLFLLAGKLGIGWKTVDMFWISGWQTKEWHKSLLRKRGDAKQKFSSWKVWCIIWLSLQIAKLLIR